MVVVSDASLMVVVATTDCAELVDGIIVGVDVVCSPAKNTNVHTYNQ